MKCTAVDSESTVSVVYAMRVAGSDDQEHLLPLNDFLNKLIRLEFLGVINCVACGRVTKKSFSSGHCFPCSQKLASCDMCQVRPETCHYDKGTCREPNWGDENCFIDHTVYLANTAGPKVGITRSYQEKTRWMDQGARQALPILQVKSRKDAGLLEVQLKEFCSDVTNWRKLITSDSELEDLESLKEELLCELDDSVGFDVRSEKALEFTYPIASYPEKAKTLSFDKQAIIEGPLLGIKGQYLFFAEGAINMRKFIGYQISCELKAP